MSEILNLKCGERFVSPKSGVTLTVNGGSFGIVPVEDAISGKAPRILMNASQDGRRIDRSWHKQEDGPETESVWAEVWERDTIGRAVCVFHGTVDSVSRKITQVG
jgi:hypothetical protein